MLVPLNILQKVDRATVFLTKQATAPINIRKDIFPKIIPLTFIINFRKAISIDKSNIIGNKIIFNAHLITYLSTSLTYPLGS